MTKKKIVVVLIFLLLGTVPLRPGMAAEQLVLSAAILDETLGQVLADLRAQSEQLLRSGEIIVDRQIRHAANQMLIVTRELEIGLAGELDKLVRTLDDSTLALVSELEILRVSLVNGEDNLIQAFEEATLDIERIVGNTIFGSYPFLFRRISGLQQLYTTTDGYSIELTGSEFGSMSVDLKSMTIEGEEFLQNVSVNRPRTNFLVLGINGDVFNAYFDTAELIQERKIEVLPVDFTFERTENAPWWRIWNRDATITLLNHSVYLYLIPSYAGALQLDPLGEEFKFEDVGEFTYIHNSTGNHCQGDCDTDDRGDWTVSEHGSVSTDQRCVVQGRRIPPIEGDQYLANPSYSGSPGYNEEESASIGSVNGFQNNCLNFRVKSRTHSATYTVSARLMQNVKMPDPVPLATIERHVEFGQTYRVNIPSNAVSVLYTIDPIGPNREKTGPFVRGERNYAIEVIDESSVGNNKVVTFRIPYPGEIPAAPIVDD